MMTRHLYSFLARLNIPKDDIPNLYDTIRSHEYAHQQQFSFSEIISFCERYLGMSPNSIFLVSKV